MKSEYLINVLIIWLQVTYEWIGQKIGVPILSVLLSNKN